MDIQIPSQTNMDQQNNTTKQQEKWKNVNHTEKTEQYGHSNSQSNKYGQHKKHYRTAEKMKNILTTQKK